MGNRLRILVGDWKASRWQGVLAENGFFGAWIVRPLCGLVSDLPGHLLWRPALALRALIKAYLMSKKQVTGTLIYMNCCEKKLPGL